MMFFVFFASFLFSNSAFAADIPLGQVVLRGLDKITGRLSTIATSIGEKAQFGALDIYVRVCYTRPPEEMPENSSFIEIVEKKTEGQAKIFSGWMFSSSPALSALDHPVYDVWVIKCQGEQVLPTIPNVLVLENPIEVTKPQPKLKITLPKTSAVSQPSTPSLEEGFIPTEDDPEISVEEENSSSVSEELQENLYNTEPSSSGPLLRPIPDQESIEETSTITDEEFAHPLLRPAPDQLIAEETPAISDEEVQETPENMSTEVMD